MIYSAQIPKRILIIGPAWVGDMVLSQALFKLLKLRNPNCQLDVLAPNWTFSLLSCMPEVTNAIELPFNHGELNFRGRYQLAKKLKKNHYHQAILLTNSLKSALIPWLARIPERTGWRGEFRYGLVNDMRFLDKKSYPRMVDQLMALGLNKNEILNVAEPINQAFFYPSFEVSSAIKAHMQKMYPVPKQDSPILALAPGGEYGPSKRWLTAYFAEIANTKIKEGWTVWLFGSIKDRAIAEEIMQLTHHQCENIAGCLQLADTITLLSLTTGLISNDSGLMHIAAALNKPLIAVYGSTSPQFTPPLSNLATVLQLNLACQPCFKRECPLGHHRCMQDLTPDIVLKAMKAWGK